MFSTVQSVSDQECRSITPLTSKQLALVRCLQEANAIDRAIADLIIVVAKTPKQRLALNGNIPIHIRITTHLLRRTMQLSVSFGQAAPNLARDWTAAARTDGVSRMTRLKIKRMYRAGQLVLCRHNVRPCVRELSRQTYFGPSSPSTCKIWTDSLGNSQSSINSHKCSRPGSFASSISFMSVSIVFTIVVLYSTPPIIHSQVNTGQCNVKQRGE